MIDIKRQLKWLSVTAVLGTFSFALEWQFAFFSASAMVNPLTLYVCIAILSLLVVGAAWVLFNPQAKLRDISELATSLGLIGTFLGMSLVFSAVFTNMSLDSPEEVKEAMNLIVAGLKTAFNTTLMGLISACYLLIYRLFAGAEDV